MTVWGVLRSFLTIGLAATLSIGAAHAQSGDAANFPSRPVKIVVPFPAGGPTDANMRILGRKLSELWNQGVVIENRPGANTGIGAQFVANAAPDGYTLLAAMDTTLVMNPATGALMSYDPFKDFEAVTLTAKNTALLTVRADGPATLKDLIARGKASTTRLSYGAGITLTRLAGAGFAKAAGIELVLLPYKGSAEAVEGLLTGSVDFIIDGIAPSLPAIQRGQFRPLAKLSRQPLPALPGLPSLAEASGLPIEDMSLWTGLVAPAGTPAAIVRRIQQDIAKATADPNVAERLRAAGITAVTSTPEEFDAYFRAEAKRWATVYKESGIKLP